jgi:hypothetical protein
MRQSPRQEVQSCDKVESERHRSALFFGRDIFVTPPPPVRQTTTTTYQKKTYESDY